MEFLDTAKSAGSAELFRKFVKRSNVYMANVDPRIAEVAAQVRERALVERQRKIAIPDATILATAILHDADVLHSFDLANLDRTNIVSGLHICRPIHISGQKGMLSNDEYKAPDAPTSQ